MIERILLTFFITLQFSFMASSEKGSILELWKTIDKKSGETLSIIKLYMLDKELRGRVEKIFLTQGQRPCVKNVKEI